MNWLMEHYADLIAIVVGLIAVAEIVVNLTPSEKDNSVLLKIKNALSAIIPNFRKGGGTH
jgi:replication-associated recombination protein RarA